MTYFQKLKIIKEKIRSKSFIAFDIETFGIRNKFLLGSVYNEYSMIFFSKKEIAEYLLNSNKDYIVASNLEFDFNAVFYDSDYFSEFKPIKSGSKFIALIFDKYKNRNEKTTFIDTYNYLNASVETYGKILNIPKLEKPDFIGDIPKTLKDLLYLCLYCARDSEISYKFIEFLQNGFNKIGCNLKLTIASTSMDLYKRKYLPFTIDSEENKFDNINKNIFRAYYGGRTEIISRGYIKNYNYYDFNSMYPSVMLNEYPNPNYVKYISYPSKDILEYEGVSFVEMECEYLHIPLLPVVWKKLIFPIGKIKGIYTNYEISKAISLGYKLKKIYWCIFYTRLFYPFRDFVDEIYKKRIEYKNKNNPIEILFKLLLNSLYGKFGQKYNNEMRFIDLFNENERELLFKEFPKAKYTINHLGKGYLQQEKMCISNFVRPIFSVYTSAYARCKLYDNIVRYKAIYTDTDSLVSKKEIAESNKLGKLKKEKFIKKGIFVKPKMYYFTDEKNNDVIRLKGIPKADIEVFDKILKSKSSKYLKFSRMTESIKKGIYPNTKMRVIKNVNLEDDKRIWNTRFNPYWFDDYSKPYKIKM